MGFTLNTAFTDDQLKTLHLTGSNVIVAKPTKGNQPNVAWQVFKPLEANTLQWEEQYGIYASTSEIKNGARLSQLSSVPVPAIEDKLYTLEPDGTISGPTNGGAPDSFSLKNKFNNNRGFMTVGLFQDATVNGTSIAGNAISAAPVLHQSTATMTPFTTVFIWIQSQVVSNSVITTVTSPMTVLRFGGGIDTISVKLDSASGKFIPDAANQKEIDASLIKHIEPML